MFGKMDTVYVKCKSGYVLRGTLPAYMSALIFTNEATARAAVQEAKRVLETGTPPETSAFIEAYQRGARYVTTA